MIQAVAPLPLIVMEVYAVHLIDNKCTEKPHGYSHFRGLRNSQGQ